MQSHKSWIDNPHAGGKRADLRGADFSHANFEAVDLRMADMRA
jgi:uncharacterized protein YjbI with pentapeptide repeats